MVVTMPAVTAVEITKGGGGREESGGGKRKLKLDFGFGFGFGFSFVSLQWDGRRGRRKQKCRPASSEG